MASKKYGNQPQKVPVPDCNGYPNNIPNTQTQKTKGAGAATKGTGHSSKMG